MPYFVCATRCAIRCISLAMLAAAAYGQSYPSRPVRIEAGFLPGTSVDILARVVAQRLNEAWKQPVIVENRSGAGGNIAAEAVAKAQADGYTLLLGNNSLVISALSYKKLPYSAQADLLPVVYVASAPHILVVAPTLPVNSVRQLIALARAKPGQLNFASSGVGTPPHLAGELFKSMAHVMIVHVPYKGSTQGLTDVAMGEIALYFSGLPPTLPLLEARKVKALAVTGKRRSETVPDVPTIAESGLPNYEVGFWYGVFAPAKSPPEVVVKLNREIDRALGSPDIRKHFASMGLDPVGGAAADFERFFRAEIEKWSQVVKTNGLKLE
jgi:tripartite-type tricarboxylate transporter receptor subunit TctC